MEGRVASIVSVVVDGNVSSARTMLANAGRSSAPATQSSRMPRRQRSTPRPSSIANNEQAETARTAATSAPLAAENIDTAIASGISPTMQTTRLR